MTLQACNGDGLISSTVSNEEIRMIHGSLECPFDMEIKFGSTTTNDLDHSTEAVDPSTPSPWFVALSVLL